MKRQLQKFTEFANKLLPQETAYLLSVQQFDDRVKLGILERVHYNCQHIDQFTPYDISIDKRKYSHLKNWIQDRLAAIDVDRHFEWMIDTERKIITDAIQLSEEKKLLKAIRQYEHPAFFFSKFYELVEQYRQFLLIRLRFSDYQLTDDFLNRYREDYCLSREVDDKLRQATYDIVQQYSRNSTESIQWEKWLNEVFYDEQLEGIKRYLAMVRLTFIGFNYRNMNTLKEKMDYVEAQFVQGKYYSKRILLNYYTNRLILHSRLKEYERAVYYGYLSVREKNHDYILYVNNLCAVLLRRNRHQEALELMRRAAPDMKATKNIHNRIGFVAFYMQALNKNGLYRNAEGYGDTFLRAYQKEVLEYRWHLFFSVYFEALLHLGRYEKLLKTAQRHQLTERDRNYAAKAGYLPTIPIFMKIAQYKEGICLRKPLLLTLQHYLDQFHDDPDRLQNLRMLYEDLQPLIPEVWSGLRFGGGGVLIF